MKAQMKAQMKVPVEEPTTAAPREPHVESALAQVAWQVTICLAALVCGAGITLALDGGPKVPGMALAVTGILLLPAGAALCERLTPRKESVRDDPR